MRKEDWTAQLTVIISVISVQSRLRVRNLSIYS